MKKIFILLALLVFVMPVFCYGLGGAAPEKTKKASYPYLIDNFADGNYSKDPEWFVFDNITPTIVLNSTLKQGGADVAEYSLNLKGAAKDWYCGGFGTMLGIDATRYNFFELNIYGTGPDSGLLKAEFYDDDNKNTDIEVDKSWKPLYDDLWYTEIKIDWKGWKHISIPFSAFKNVGKGDNVFNPDLQEGSSGLNKIQLIVVANSQKGSVDFNIDSLEFGVAK